MVTKVMQNQTASPRKWLRHAKFKRLPPREWLRHANACGMQAASPRNKRAASPRKILSIKQGGNFSRDLRAVKVATFSVHTSATTKPFIKQFFISKNLFI